MNQVFLSFIAPPDELETIMASPSKHAMAPRDRPC
jgi:hypothetical protein